ncbi:MAG: imidazole glycerol phosphate synthase subunit HisH [Casimicrobiaceae bacterium]|nr:imidazole glycerol phosphate synthase subunit HisH [Casimicrobiaceae bacterium]
MSTVAIVDYGMGNLRSLAKALAHVAPKQRVLITQAAADIEAADRVVLPGQAAMPESMAALEGSGLRSAVERAARDRPFFGVCLGMQMLLEHSEEGDVPALGLMAGRVRRFPHEHRDAAGGALKVPHMGWNCVRQRFDHPLWHGVPDRSWFYFAHSYYCAPSDADLVAGESSYPWPFPAALARANIFAVQFHPEKSAEAGLRVLYNFLHWDGRA